MSAKKIKTAQIDKVEYLKYWYKAQEFFGVAEDCLINNKWNAAALSAIHSAISANDAVLVFFHGVKSTSSKHGDAIRLLGTLSQHEKTKENALRLQRLISSKHLVEYESRLFTQKEAENLHKQAQRFLEWAKSILPKK
jgi:HEPN domain-containing protein